MRLAELRKNLPEWEWKAERSGGIGWHYIGVRGDQQVTIRAYAVLGGYCEDDYVTEWRVEENGTSEHYCSWLFRHWKPLE